MRITPGSVLLLMVAVAAATGLLSAVLRAAGDDVSLGVAIAALAVMPIVALRLVVRYARVIRSAPRLTEPDEHAAKRLRRESFGHMAVLWSMPFVVFATWPWGPATLVIGWGAAMLCQLVIAHGVTVVMIGARRRARQELAA